MDGECQRSPTVFLAAAFVVAAEALDSLRPGRSRTLVVTAFLLTQWNAGAVGN